MNSRAPSPYIIAEPPACLPGVDVRWSGIPKAGEACSFTGLGHAYYYTKLLQPPFVDGFVHLSLREKGESKGKRLFLVPSLHRLLTHLAQGKVHVRGDRLTGKLSGERFEKARQEVVPHKWLRVPPNGKTCAFSGLGHAVFYSLLESAGDSVETAQLKRSKESRATNLVWIPDLHEYLVSLAQKQATKQAAEAATRHAA